MKLFNSKSGQLEDFVPIDPTNVRMYVCGPTVYSAPHVGNARPAVAFDVLFRVLRHKYGYKHVKYVSNYTDIDDKIIKRAQEEGISHISVTETAKSMYYRDMGHLNVLDPNERPLATEYVDKMIDMIQVLIDKGHAYVGDNGDVLFYVPSNNHPGLENNRQDHQTRLEEPNNSKRDPRDFVLWKPVKPGEPYWESPWGRGRPGWHIECSAMIAATLGHTIDIHGGGSDLKFPHHEAEMAQSYCAHDAPLANYWLHNGMIHYQQGKMAKSHGNIFTVHDLNKVFPHEAIRLGLMMTHYRQILNADQYAPFIAGREIIDSLYRVWFDYAEAVHFKYWDYEVHPDVVEALENDMNTPLAISVLQRLAGLARTDQANRIKHLSNMIVSARFMGLLKMHPEEWFHANVDKFHMVDLLSERNSARRKKDWAQADKIRDQLKERGIEIEDLGGSTFWRTLNGHLNKE